MKITNKGVIKKFSYSLLANLISTLSAVALLLIIPKFIGIQDYGYWQLYLFYGSYLGYFHFGLLDGIYLRNGGKKYDQLDKGKLSFQFYLLTFFNTAILVAMFFMAYHLAGDSEKSIVVFLTLINGLILIPRLYLSYIFQATGRIKEYSVSLIIDKGLSLIIISLACFLGYKNFFFLIILDLIAKLLSLIYSLFYCSDLILTRPAPFKESKIDLKANIVAGIKIMLSSLTSMLLIGIARFQIESIWNIETFAKISLTFSISNVLITFINSIAIVIFPMLHNYPREKLATLYIAIKKILHFFLFGVLAFYPLLVLLIQLYLPKYGDTIMYMTILLPMSIFECKTCLLTNTFLKSMRQENTILKGNFLTLVLSAIASTISLYVFGNIYLCLFLIVFSIGFRSFYLEIKLRQKIQISLDFIEEIALIVVFIVCNLYFNSYIAMLLYLTIYAFYLIWNYKKIKHLYKIIFDRKNNL